MQQLLPHLSLGLALRQRYRGTSYLYEGLLSGDFYPALVLETLCGPWLPAPGMFAGMPLASLAQGRVKYRGKKWSSLKATGH